MVSLPFPCCAWWEEELLNHLYFYGLKLRHLRSSVTDGDPAKGTFGRAVSHSRWTELCVSFVLRGREGGGWIRTDGGGVWGWGERARGGVGYKSGVIHCRVYSHGLSKESNFVIFCGWCIYGSSLLARRRRFNTNDEHKSNIRKIHNLADCVMMRAGACETVLP